MSTCYSPNGDKTGGYPCWNTTGSNQYAPCCSNNSYCYSNGWCLESGAMTVYRGGCTDPTWKSDSCVKECTGGPIGGIYKCDDAGHAACFASDCGTDLQFSVASGSLLLSGPAAKSALNAHDYVSASASSSGSSTVTLAATVTRTITATAEAASADPKGNNSNQFSSGALAGVGVGVGLPLLIALLTSIFFLLKERKKTKKLQTHPPHSISEKRSELPQNASAPAYAANYQQTQPYQPIAQPRPHELGAAGHGSAELD